MPGLGLHQAQLFVERLEGLFEHSPVRGGGGATKVFSGARASHLERPAPVPSQPF